MKWDLDLYDRAKEGTPMHSYNVLIQSIRDLLTRERVRRNRDRIAKSLEDKFGALLPGRKAHAPSREAVVDLRPGIAIPRSGHDQAPGITGKVQ